MYVPRAMNSLRMSFWTVPCSLPRGTPCSSPTTTYIASSTGAVALMVMDVDTRSRDRKSTRLNSSHGYISYAVFCLKKKKKKKNIQTLSALQTTPLDGLSDIPRDT